MDNSFSSPVTLTLQNSLKKIFCEKILRHLPGKRTVYLAQWESRPVVVKVFYHRRAKYHVKREIIGSQALKSAHILAPKLLQVEKAGNYTVVIYEYIPHGHTLSKDIPGPQALEISLKALAVIAQYHEARLRHTDVHLDNFLLSQDFLYLLDPGSIKQYHAPISIKNSLRDVAIFLASCQIRDESVLKRLFKAYIEARRYSIKASHYKIFKRILEKHQEKRLKLILEKAYRPSTQTGVFHSFRRFYCYKKTEESPALHQALLAPEIFIQQQASSSLKLGRTCSVFKSKLNEKTIVIKRYNLKNRMHALKRLLQPSRASRSWYFAHVLQHYKIPTATPIAFCEERFGPLKRRSYYLSDYIAGEPLDVYFSKILNSESALKDIVRKIIFILEELLYRRLYHGDLKASNFYVSQNEVYLIDLDSMTQHHSKRAAKKAHQNDIARFLKNWEHQPTIRGLFSCLSKNDYS